MKGTHIVEHAQTSQNRFRPVRDRTIKKCPLATARLLRYLLVAMLTVLSLAGLPSLGPRLVQAATTYTFTGLGQDHTSWTDPQNWSPQAVPPSGSDVIIEEQPGGPADVSKIPPGTVLDGLTLAYGGSITDGDITVMGTLTWTGGAINNAVSVAAGGTADISGTDTKTLSTGFGAGTLSLGGSATLSGSGPLVLDGAAIITNTGTLTLQPGTALNAMACCIMPAQLVNLGSVVIPSTPGAGTVTLNSVSFNDSGTVSVDSGSTLDLHYAPDTISSGASFTGAGRTLVEGMAGATATLGRNVSLSAGTTFELGDSGALSGSGSFSGSGTFVWSGGQLEGSLAIPSTITTVITGTATKTLDNGNFIPGDGILSLAGPTTFSGSGPLAFAGAAAITNTGTFTVTQGTTMQAGGAPFDNAGTFVSAVGSGTATLNGVAFDNTGTVVLQSGTLAETGAIYTQTAGVTELTGGALSSANPLNIAGGRISGHGTITGTVSNAGGVQPSTSGGPLAIAGSFTQMKAGTLYATIAGTTPGAGYSQLNVSGAATLSGTLSITTTGGFAPTLGQSFRVLAYASHTGTFSRIVGQALSGGLAYAVSYGSTDVNLVVEKAADVSVSGSAPATVPAGTRMTYKETVHNAGPNPATGVTLADTLPAGVTFVSASASAGTCTGTSKVVCTLGSVAVGANVTVTITIVPTVKGTIVNTATVSTSAVDLNGANNTARQTTTVT